MGLIESTSLWVGIPVEVRLPTAGSPQTPRKRDPHWEFVVVVVVVIHGINIILFTSFLL